MRDASMEQINLLHCEETEIDLCQCVKIVAKHKKTFAGVFLFVLGVGLWCFLSSPEIYRISVSLQPSVIGEALTEDNYSKFTENLKGLIMSDSFNEALGKRLNQNPNKNPLKFNVIIPDKSNILQVSIDLERKKREFGVVILQNLVKLISDRNTKSIEAKISDIVSAKEKANNLQEQIREITARRDELIEKKKSINISTEQILKKRDELLKANAAAEDATTLLLANQVQSHFSYLIWVNKQLLELSLHKVRLGLELRNINSLINNFQMEIASFKISKDYIPSLRVISQPKVSPIPISSKKMKTLGLFLVMGVFSGVLAVLLQEFWVSKLRKHD